MSILSEFEDRVGRAVEGMFAGVFRSPVQPAELARACGKEMDRRRKLGVGKVYAPTLYSVLLSPEDGRTLGGFSDTLAGELETYLIGYAREHNYELTTRPRVRFLVDDGLKLGRFEVIGELMSPEEIANELGDIPDDDGFYDPDADVDEQPATPPHAEDEPSDGADVWAPAGTPLPPAPLPAAAVAGAAAPAAAAVPAGPAFVDAEELGFGEPGVGFPEAEPEFGEPDLGSSTSAIATVTISGVEHDVVLTGDRMVIGRLKACDICLRDANASRQHAALEREGSGWSVVDLQSTNGTRLNGQRVARERLRDGDVITVGVTELVYHEPRG